MFQASVAGRVGCFRVLQAAPKAAHSSRICARSRLARKVERNTPMHNFTPWSALIGGALIGLAASLLMLFNGRTAGVSGIFEGLLAPKSSEFAWRLMFVAGLAIGGFGWFLASPESFEITLERHWLTVAAAGLLVGFGARLGSGCTSGHGVCGISGLRRRSLLHVVTFILSGAVTVVFVNQFGGAQ